MVRQCAWCLRLIDDAGDRLSLAPLPKLYEASHGICDTCGKQWMEQVLASQTIALSTTLPQGESATVEDEISEDYSVEEGGESVSEFVLQLQSYQKLFLSVSRVKCSLPLKIF